MCASSIMFGFFLFCFFAYASKHDAMPSITRGPCELLNCTVTCFLISSSVDACTKIYWALLSNLNGGLSKFKWRTAFVMVAYHSCLYLSCHSTFQHEILYLISSLWITTVGVTFTRITMVGVTFDCNAWNIKSMFKQEYWIFVWFLIQLDGWCFYECIHLCIQPIFHCVMLLFYFCVCKAGQNWPLFEIMRMGYFWALACLKPRKNEMER